MTPTESSIESTDLIGLPTLMTLAFTGGDIAAVADQLLKRIKRDPKDATAQMDMAVILIMRGDTKLALSMKALALRSQQIYSYRRPALPIELRALMILGPGDLMANSPFEFLLDGQPVALDLVYISSTLTLPAQLPEHDVLIVAIGESDINQALLAELEQTLDDWPRPVINRPARIAQLARDSSCALLTDLPNVLMPPTLRVSRATLEECCRPPRLASTLVKQLNGVDYPIIIRPIDSHAGNGLNKIDDLVDLTNYLINSSLNEFFVAPFIDYRSADGLFRKYRVILIDGIPFLCHLAISQRWMVHYLNADMLENLDHRNEEARCMAEFSQTFAQRHAAALHAITQKLGLDYVGLDCAETPDGKLLIFEADSNMVVHDMDAADKFPYKKIQMPKLFHAFAQLLARRCEKNL